MVIKLLSVVMILFAVTTTVSARCPLWKASGGCLRNTLRVHREFKGAVNRINYYACHCRVRIYVTQSFRKDGVVVKGAIVPPSKTSNHLVGHAIDMNLVDGSFWCNSACLRNPNKQTEGVKCFLSKIRGDANLRWGGDFRRSDPVHIDDDLYRRNKALYKQRYLSVQRNCPATL